MNIVTYLFSFLGLLFIIQGIVIWKKQIITLTFDFNSKNVKKEDVKPYTKSFGIAYIISGIAIILSTMSQVVFNGSFQDEGSILFLILFTISMIIIIKTQVKYKTGLYH